jgi:hypothetical protein
LSHVRFYADVAVSFRIGPDGVSFQCRGVLQTDFRDRVNSACKVDVTNKSDVFNAVCFLFHVCDWHCLLHCDGKRVDDLSRLINPDETKYDGSRHSSGRRE